LGSGGGNGYQSRGGAGGGAIRLEVGGFCYVNGAVTANGARGTDYIYGGGGSGGSIFLTAGVLTGTGTIAANGALGTGAGGGGGGRVALYSGIIVGLLNPPTVAGGITGTGSNTNLNGRAGTVFTSNSPPSLQVVSLSPSGTVLQPVSSVDVNFNLAIDAATFTPVDVLVTTPSGPLPGGQITVTPVGGPRFRIGFPVQSTPGVYQLQVGPHVQDVFGREMDQNGDGVPGQVTNDIYYGSFSIANSRILAGTVRQTNGTPVADVILQAGTFATARTGSNGTYTLLVPVGWSGTVTPTRTGCTLAPATRSYTNVSANQVGQDYALTIAFAPTLTAVPQGAQLRVEWPSIVGILYQLQTSPDLVTWGKAGPPLAGNGAVLSWLFDTTGSPLEFYRVLATN
jgi:hypothetical protein